MVRLVLTSYAVLSLASGCTATGAPGTQGPSGPRGGVGPAGASVSVAPLEVGSAECPAGGALFTSDAGVAAACNGAEGAPGPTGPTGAPGAAGQQGAVGPVGPSGPAGLAGLPAEAVTIQAATRVGGVPGTIPACLLPGGAPNDLLLLAVPFTVTLQPGEEVLLWGSAFFSWSGPGMTTISVGPCYRPVGGALDLAGFAVSSVPYPFSTTGATVPVGGRVAPGAAGTFEVGVCACTAYTVGPTPIGAAATILVYRPTSTSAIQ